MTARNTRVALAGITAALVIATLVAGKAARDAIFLSTYDVTSLPLFIGLAAAVSIPLVLLTGRLMVRFGPARLVPSLNVLSAGLHVLEWLALDRHPALAAGATFIHLGALGAVLVSGFWSIVNERFEPRTARRHIANIGIAATVGGVIGGLVAERAAVMLPAGAILLVLAAMQATSAIALHLLGDAGARAPANVTDDAGGAAALAQVARSSLLRTLAAVIALDAIAATALDYAFKAEVSAASGEAGPLRFFAIYYTATNVVTAVVQLVVARRAVEQIGVARAVGTLPFAISLFGGAALVVPGLAPLVVARGSEMVMRSSVYRAAYELLFAPLLETHKRSSKVVLDVGIERAGDLLGAQVVAALLFLTPAPRTWLVGSAVLFGLAALAFAMRLPRAYTAELEHSLRTRAGRSTPPQGVWNMGHSFAEAGDFTAMSLIAMREREPGPTTPTGAVHRDDDPLVQRLAELRSRDARRVRAALVAPLPPELARAVVDLVAWDEVAPAAIVALRAVAPRVTGVLVDALLDRDQPFALRRRMPAIVEAGVPALAVWGLWRGLEDTRFEVRYRCGRALARLAARGHAPGHSIADTFAAVAREISVDAEVWRNHRLIDRLADADAEADADRVLREVMRRRSSLGVHHIFTLLGFALPAEPLRLAFEALQTDDAKLRGTALEYLETVLPPDVRAAFLPLVDAAPTRAPTRGTGDMLARLRISQEMVREDLMRQVGEYKAVP